MIKNFIQKNRLSVLLGIFLTVIMIYIFSNHDGAFTQRFQLIAGVITVLLIGISILPKMKGIFIPAVVLVILSLITSFY